MKGNETTEKALRFAALRRVSTEQQEKVGESLLTQTTDIQEIATSLGGSLVEWYGGQEHATPGHEKHEVNRLLLDAQKQPKKFDAVIVAHPDRWSRDNSASHEGLQVFREHGIRFFAGGTEYDLFNPDHELFLGISAVVGQFQARNQMRKSLLNRINRAKRGVPTGGKLPFGRKFIRSNDRQGGHWEIEPEKQRLIQEAAQRYLAGEGIEDLAQEYEMNASNLHKVLMKVSGPKWQLEFTSKVLNIHETVEMVIPALLDDETIAAVKSRAKSNRTYHHGHIKHHYLFSHMISCAHCGYAIMGQTNHNGLQYYRHVHAERDRVCPGPERKTWVPAAEIEDAAMRHLFETFGNPVAVQRAIAAATPNNDKTQEAARRLTMVTEDLTKLERSRQRILDLVVKGTIADDSASTQLEKLKEREQRLEAERRLLNDELAHVPSREAITAAGVMIAGQFARYTNAKAVAKGRHANAVFEEMTYAEKRELCQAVFSGQTADGRRMGIWVTWSDDGKKWRYQIDGHLIDTSGPLPEVGKSALH